MRSIPVLIPTSFPGSLFSASLGRWKKDPGCGWSHDHPESGWQKNLLGGRGGRVLCLVDVTKTLWASNPLAVAKNYSLFRGFEVEFADDECYMISAVFRIQKTFVHKEIRQPNGAETF